MPGRAARACKVQLSSPVLLNAGTGLRSVSRRLPGMGNCVIGQPRQLRRGWKQQVLTTGLRRLRQLVQHVLRRSRTDLLADDGADAGLNNDQ